jgi:hypothetical protein
MQNNVEVTHLVSTAYKHHYAAGQLRRKVADLLQERSADDNCQRLHHVRMLRGRTVDAEGVELNGTKNGEFAWVTSPKEVRATGLLKLSKESNETTAKSLGTTCTHSRPVSP